MRVTCAIVKHENKILVTQRGPGMSQPFKWEFPGGKTEPDETDEESIHRELKEELNINVNLTGKLDDCFYDYGKFTIVLVPFIAELAGGYITLSEHMKFAWLKPEELVTLDWAPADVGVMEQYLKFNSADKE